MPARILDHKQGTFENGESEARHIHAQDRFSSKGGDCIAEFLDLSRFPFAPLDHQVLRIMVREATRAENGGTVNWRGITVGDLAMRLGVKSTIENRGTIRRALNVLMRNDRAYKLKRRENSTCRYFPSTREIERHAFAQARLEGFV